MSTLDLHAKFSDLPVHLDLNLDLHQERLRCHCNASPICVVCFFFTFDLLAMFQSKSVEN